jgi:hypothetical protein
MDSLNFNRYIFMKLSETKQRFLAFLMGAILGSSIGYLIVIFYEL